MKKKCKVVMLTTKKTCPKNGIFINVNGNPVQAAYYNPMKKQQHLYIISDDEIEVGDWVYNTKLNKLWQHKGKNVAVVSISNKKVIASTDSELFQTTDYKEFDLVDGDKGSMEARKQLPQIPESFIKAYVEAGGIDEVMVEYDTQNFLDKSNGLFEEKELINGLKLTDNNEVIILMLEEKMYSRDEVIRLLNDDRAEWTDFNKWIEENL